MKKRVVQAVFAAFGLVLMLDFTIDNKANTVNTLEVSEAETSLVSGAASLSAVNIEELEVLEVEDSESVAVAMGPICGYENVGICRVTEGNLNVRETPVDGKVVGKFPLNAACEVLGEEDGWFLIKSGNVEGYVSGDYLVTGIEGRIQAEKLASIVAKSTTGGLNVRMEPNTECGILAQMAEGEEVEYVADENDEWIKVLVDDEVGYVFADYVSVELSLPHAMTIAEMRYGAGVSDVRSELCEYALQFVGNPYVWGGTSLTKGADCSGFVLSVFAKYGISLPHHSGSQAGYGTSIKASAAQPGDLFFYSNGSRINHVAIYIGGGQIVHASNPRTGIKISNAYYRTPVKVVSLLD
ncbi:MAG: C40 family peptidase [Pseudobutyrivibrio sp.]|nr:C40 family peptidase [Pseudobutyrivibrio sp.]